MSRRKGKGFSRLLVLAGLIVLGGSFLLSGCTMAPKTPQALNPGISEPQVVVDPPSVRLGVAKITGTNIVFTGSGFEPGDAVFVTISGPSEEEIALTSGQVKDDGTFQAAVGPLGKVVGILRANVSGDYTDAGVYNQYIVVTQPPVPAGIYTVRAMGMVSGEVAETELYLCEPWGVDRLKDWLGVKVGKIKDQTPR